MLHAPDPRPAPGLTPGLTLPSRHSHTANEGLGQPCRLVRAHDGLRGAGKIYHKTTTTAAKSSSSRRNTTSAALTAAGCPCRRHFPRRFIATVLIASVTATADRHHRSPRRRFHRRGRHHRRLAPPRHARHFPPSPPLPPSLAPGPLGTQPRVLPAPPSSLPASTLFHAPLAQVCGVAISSIYTKSSQLG